MHKRKNIFVRRRTQLWITVASVALALTATVATAAAFAATFAPARKANAPAKGSSTPAGGSSAPAGVGVVYENQQYGFRFSLPADWRGYTIVTDKWEGESSQNGQVVQTGPTLLIRSSLWTAQTPRQDIPIMVFTLAQWNALQADQFHIGAAPIGPTELGRNSAYVFALPARYNYAFPPGYEEVETILAGHPLEPFAPGGENK